MTGLETTKWNSNSDHNIAWSHTTSLKKWKVGLYKSNTWIKIRPIGLVPTKTANVFINSFLCENKGFGRCRYSIVKC